MGAQIVEVTSISSAHGITNGLGEKAACLALVTANDKEDGKGPRQYVLALSEADLGQNLVGLTVMPEMLRVMTD